MCFARVECAVIGRDGKLASLYEQSVLLWDETVSPGEDDERPRGVSSLLSRFQVRDTPSLRESYQSQWSPHSATRRLLTTARGQLLEEVTFGRNLEESGMATLQLLPRDDPTTDALSEDLVPRLLT